LVKTLLLAALVPEVECLKGMTAARLVALNHGTIKAPIPGQETGLALKKLKDWAADVGEIRLQEPDQDGCCCGALCSSSVMVLFGCQLEMS
jgi:hypothetical protein